MLPTISFPAEPTAVVTVCLLSNWSYISQNNNKLVDCQSSFKTSVVRVLELSNSVIMNTQTVHRQVKAVDQFIPTLKGL